MTEPVIEAADIVKILGNGAGQVQALKRVSLALAGGQLTLLMGPSGSGKSSLLYVLGALEPPTSGTVTLDGQDPFQLPAAALAAFRNRSVGFVFQEYNLLSGLNVLENVMLPLRYIKDGKNGRQRALELLERVGLSDRLRHRPTELSGGQAQRVAIARSMMNNPSLILLDEPTGAVDTETAQQLIDLLKRLNREDQVTVVIVTHDLDIAGQASRQIRLKDGKVLTDELVRSNGVMPGVGVA